MINFQEYQEELLHLRRTFHQYPELALKEEKTSAFIRDYMEKLGYVLTPVPPTGWMAELPSLQEKKKQILFRAEMDALPISEQTELPYASVHPGVMHACGHDAILSTALIVAKILARKKETFPAGVRFLFEPAEEIGEGAKRMLKSGAIKEGENPIFLMFHFAPDGCEGMAIHRGQASAMISGMRILVQGRSSHWCEAEKGIDSIYAAALVVQAMEKLNRTYPRRGPCLTGAGTIHGGAYPNIIADEVILEGNIRACYEEDFYGLRDGLTAAFQEIEKETGARISMTFPKEPVLPFANDDRLVDLGIQAGKQEFQERFVLEGEEELFLAGDNAYRYFLKSRGLFLVFLAGMGQEGYPLHHPKFLLDESMLIRAVRTLWDLLERIGREEEDNGNH